MNRSITLLVLLTISSLSYAGTLNDYNPYNVTIPDNDGSVSSDLLLSGAPSNATITKVKVYYEIRHTYPWDLDIWLTTYYNGAWHDYFLYHQGDLGSADNVIETRDNIHAWDGASPNQTWYLSVRDRATGDVGYIDFFELWVTYTANGAPSTPSSPDPSDDATNVSRTTDLDWSCSDPDGDTVYYTVYFEKNDSSPDTIIKNDSTGSYADPGTLDYSSHYYWQVKADDHKGGVSLSPIWDFYTQSNPNGNLYVYVKNQNNVWPGGTGRVVLYRGGSSWQFSVGSDGIAYFTDKPAAIDYSYEVYYDGARGEEYWGDELNVTIPSGGSTGTSNFKRFYPYATSFVLKNDSTNQVINPDDSVELGTTIRAEVNVYNGLSGVPLNCYVQTISDRDQTLPYDNSPTSSILSVPASGNRTFATTFTPTETGTYYKALKVFSQLGSGTKLTDGTAFGQALTVETTFPNITGRIAFHSYTSYDALDSRIKVCQMPDQMVSSITTIDTNTRHAMNPHFSSDGSLLVFMAHPIDSPTTGGAWWYMEVFLYDYITNTLIQLTDNDFPSEDPKFSPDGSKIVFKIYDNASGNSDIYTMDLDASNLTRLTATTSYSESGPFYSSDGSKISYWINSGSSSDIWWMNSDGTGQSELITNSNVQDYYPIFINNNFLVYTRWRSSSLYDDDVYIRNLTTMLDSSAAFNSVWEDADAFPVNNELFVLSSNRDSLGDYDLYLGNYISGDIWPLSIASTNISDLGSCYTPTDVIPSTRMITVNSIPEGASFTISGEGINTFEYTGTTPWSNNQMQSGNYTIVWNPIAGYITPPSETKYLVSGNVSFTGNYSQIPLGTITIDPNPDQLNAAWILDGPNGYTYSSNGDETIADLEFGSYTITWSTIPSWNTPLPNPDTKNLSIGNSINFIGNYQLIADYNNDYFVDIEDLAIFVNYWLVSDPSIDLTGDDFINFSDFAIFAGNWMQGL